MTINSTQLQFILDNTPSDQNIMLVGKHGIGKSRILENYFYQKGKQSVNLASINKTVLSALTLPLPTLEKQREIINHIESRLSACDSIEHTVDLALQQAEAMRQSILKDAFEGRL